MAVGCAWLWNARGRPFLSGPAQTLEEMDPIHAETWRHFLTEAKGLRAARRAHALTGDLALEELVHLPLQGVYLQQQSSQYTPLVASLVAEPTEPEKAVDLLTSLPPDLAERYSSEEALLGDKTWDESERQLCRRLGATVGGSKKEYAMYFRRPETRPLWTFVEPWQVKGTCAFKAVWKKDKKAQRRSLPH